MSLYTLWEPELVFSDTNSTEKLHDSRARTVGIINAFSAVPGLALGFVGIPPAFIESLNTLICFVANVETTSEALMSAKIDKARAKAATASLNSKILAVQGRLQRLYQKIPKREREIEVIPALHTCEEIFGLFEDQSSAFWNKPEVSSPLLVSFVGIYIAVAMMTVEIFESYRAQISTSMHRLGNTVDDYRKRFLCFRLQRPKYPIFSFKDVIDKYDAKHRTTPKSTFEEEFDCFCLHKQMYTHLLARTYGSFFDSAKSSIILSGLLDKNLTIKNEWCTSCSRCLTVYQPQTICFCKGLKPNYDHIVKNNQIEKMVAEGKCLYGLSCSDTYLRDYIYICLTCEVDDDVGICRSCIKKCHKGHTVDFLRYDWFYCDCGDQTSSIQCQLQGKSGTFGSKIKKNRDGVEVTLGSSTWTELDPVIGLSPSKLYYCGRKMNQCRCGSCDGFCGPSNGCPCIACLELIPVSKSKNSTASNEEHPSKKIELTKKFSFDTYVWVNIYCDGCTEKVVGARFKCVDCNDYDLCHSCVKKGIHQEHNLIKLTRPTHQQTETIRETVHRFNTCDACGMLPLCGNRFKCTVCEDYDLCTKCHQGGIHKKHEFKQVGECFNSDQKGIKGWHSLVQAMQNMKANSMMTKANEQLSDEDSDEESESSEDLIKSCILMERMPKIPFSKPITLQPDTICYVLSIQGRIPKNPRRFEVNIWNKDTTTLILQINPRWDEGKTVFNSFDGKWGQEEYAFFPSLLPNSDMTLEIEYQEDAFQISFNNDDIVMFKNRIRNARHLTIEVKGDLAPSFITFDIYQ